MRSSGFCPVRAEKSSSSTTPPMPPPTGRPNRMPPPPAPRRSSTLPLSPRPSASHRLGFPVRSLSCKPWTWAFRERLPSSRARAAGSGWPARALAAEDATSCCARDRAPASTRLCTWVAETASHPARLHAVERTSALSAGVRIPSSTRPSSTSAASTSWSTTSSSSMGTDLSEPATRCGIRLWIRTSFHPSARPGWRCPSMEQRAALHHHHRVDLRPRSRWAHDLQRGESGRDQPRQVVGPAQLAPSNIRVNSVSPGSISFEGGTWWKRQQEQPAAMADVRQARDPDGPL